MSKSSIFFTSDTHFGQQRTFDYSMRSMYFKDVKEMDKEMIKRWNETVSDNDIVYHLGDFGDYEVAKKLNGKIILLFGNYERDDKYSLTEDQARYFYHVIDEYAMYIDIEPVRRLTNEYLMAVHEPENKTLMSNNFYVFGHIHEKQKVKMRGLNVGVDVHNFYPVSIDTLMFYMNAILNIYDANCFLNY